METDRTPRRRRPQFTVRTLFVVVGALAILAAIAKAYPEIVAVAAIAVASVAMWFASDLFQWVSRTRCAEIASEDWRAPPPAPP
jgi:hypothetical protein